MKIAFGILLLCIASAILWFVAGPAEPVASAALRIAWATELPDPGSIMATPLIDGESVWVTAIEDNGTFRAAGSVVRLDSRTGKAVSRWDNRGKMLHAIGSPSRVGTRIVVGEGMHANRFCGLSAFDAASGETLWRYPVRSHIEGAAVSDGRRIVFPAGDDGLVCLNLDGSKRWHFSGSLHFDASPILTPDAVLAGSAISRARPEAAIVWLDPDTGAEIRRMPTEMSVWNLLIDDDRLIASCGNGKLLSSDKNPRGAWLMLDRKTGRRIWQCDARDNIPSPGLIDDGVLIAGSRDGWLYRIACDDGRIVDRWNLGSPVLSSPMRYRGGCLVVASSGKVWEIPKGSGPNMRLDLAGELGARVTVAGSPKLDAFGRIIVVAEIFRGGPSSAGIFALEESP